MSVLSVLCSLQYSCTVVYNGSCKEVTCENTREVQKSGIFICKLASAELTFKDQIMSIGPVFDLNKETNCRGMKSKRPCLQHWSNSNLCETYNGPGDVILSYKFCRIPDNHRCRFWVPSWIVSWI